MNVLRSRGRNWCITALAAGVLLVCGAWLAFGYFGVQTAVIDDEVDEAAPVFDAAPAAVVDDQAAPSTEPAAEPGSAPATDETPTGSPAANADSNSDAGETPAGLPAKIESEIAADAADAAVAEEPADAPEDPAVAPGEIVTESAGEFIGINGYAVNGDALVLGNGTNQRFLRFENFESDNGPDLNVYLINPDDPDDCIYLGNLSG